MEFFKVPAPIHRPSLGFFQVPEHIYKLEFRIFPSFRAYRYMYIKKRSSEFLQVPQPIFRPGVGIFPSPKDIFPNMTSPGGRGG